MSVNFSLNESQLQPFMSDIQQSRTQKSNKVEPTIYTSKITTIENLKTLSEITSKWKREVKELYKKNMPATRKRAAKLCEIKKSWHVVDDIHDYLKDIVKNKKKYLKLSIKYQESLKNTEDNQELQTFIESKMEKKLSKLEKKANKYAVYIAHDNKKVIQGIVISSVNSDESASVVDHIVTNPCSIADPSKKIKGVGTALMNHVVVDMKKSNESDNLYLYSLASSIDFYSKIGLIVSESDSSSNDSSSSSSDDEIQPYCSDDDLVIDSGELVNQKKMRLSPENVDSFIVRTKSPVARTLSEEPKL